MPRVLFSAHWLPREGPKLVMIYPEEIISRDALLDIFGLALRQTLIYEEEFVSGYYTARVPSMAPSGLRGNIAVYITGKGRRIVMGLLLGEDEDPYIYKGALIWSLIEYVNKGMTTDIETLDFIWRKILAYPRMPLEQKIMDILADMVARLIIDVLSDEGYIIFHDLARGITDRSYIKANVELLHDYVRVLEGLGILYVDINPIQLEEFIYLVRRPYITLTKPRYIKRLLTRKPELKEEIRELAEKHLSQIEEWTKIFASVLEDPAAYDLLSALRDKPIPKDNLTENQRALMDEFIKLDIVREYENKYYLIFDPRIAFILPEETVVSKLEKILSGSESEIEILTLIRWLSILEHYY